VSFPVSRLARSVQPLLVLEHLARRSFWLCRSHHDGPAFESPRIHDGFVGNWGCRIVGRWR
jgi:hypothetical protein